MNIQTQASILNEDQKRVFESEYESRKKSKKPLVVLPVLMPVQLLVLGRIGDWESHSDSKWERPKSDDLSRYL